VQPYDGDLEDYADWLKQRQSQEKALANAQAQQENPKTELKVDKKQDRKEAAEQRERLRPLKQQCQKLEKEMDKLSAELAQIEALLADAAIYEAEQKIQLQQALQQQGSLKSRLNEVEEQWLEAQDAIEVMSLS
jgi:ATP-binding cassette subfamily F protein 3